MNIRRILLVEDNAQDELLTLRTLEKAKLVNGIDVVRDGAAALDFLLARGEFSGRDPADLPAVVILDIKLPKLSGLEVLRRLRMEASAKLLPVVMLTSSDEERDRIASYRLGANSYVRKPVEFAEFSEAVVRLGVYWLEVNEPPGTTESNG